MISISNEQHAYAVSIPEQTAQRQVVTIQGAKAREHISYTTDYRISRSVRDLLYRIVYDPISTLNEEVLRTLQIGLADGA